MSSRKFLYINVIMILIGIIVILLIVLAHVSGASLEINDDYFYDLFKPESIATFVLAVSTVALWRSTQKLAELGADQARITNKLFLIDQQPWLSVEFNLSRKTSKYELSLQDIYVTARIKNAGKSPATRVFVFCNTIFKHTTSGINIEQFILSKSCAEIAKDISVGNTIFPDQQHHQKETLELSGDMMLQYLEVRSFSRAEEYFDLGFIGCVQYKGEVDDRWHQTGFIYKILIKDDNQISIQKWREDGRTY